MKQYFEIIQRISFSVDIFTERKTSLQTQATDKVKSQVEADFYCYMCDYVFLKYTA